MKKIFALAISLSAFIFTNKTHAQQLFRMSQYVQHNFIYNPAAAGITDSGSIGVTYKKMWNGIEGGPQTTILYADKYFTGLNTGAGFVLYNDVTGFTARSGMDLNMAYALRFSGNRKLQFGLNIQLLQERIDKAAIEKYVPGDPILAGPGSKMTADAGAGIYYASPGLSGGVSVKQIVQSKLGLISAKTDEAGRLYRHYYLTANYNWVVDEANTIIPSMMIRMSEKVPADVELGAIIMHKGLFWTGFGMHQNQDFSAYAGLRIKDKYTIGYAFDQYKTPLSSFDGGAGAHEVSLRYFFRK